MRTIRKQLNELIATDRGKISNTKVWAFIGCAVATWIMIYMTLKDKMSWELFVAYLGTVGGFSQVSKWLSYRYGGSPITTPATTEAPSATAVVEKCTNCPSPEEVKRNNAKADEGQD